MEPREMIALLDEIDRLMAEYTAGDDGEIPDIAALTERIRSPLAHPDTRLAHAFVLDDVLFTPTGTIYECSVADSEDGPFYRLEATDGDLDLDGEEVMNYEGAARLIKECAAR